MAYAAPPNFATGAILTEAQLDTLSDDITFLANPPHCRVYNSAAWSHATSGSYLAVAFDSERKDTDTMHSTATNTSRISFTTAGWYDVGGHLEFAANATGVRGIQIRLNGATVLFQSVVPTFGAGIGHSMAAATSYQFSATDYVELMAYQNSGGALNVSLGANYSPEFYATWKAL